VLLVGPLPTPGIAFLTRTLRADAGVVISASHNPFPDNGIKFFSQAGFKLPDELEEEIEHLVLGDAIDALRPTATEIGKAFRIDERRRPLQRVREEHLPAPPDARRHAHRDRLRARRGLPGRPRGAGGAGRGGGEPGDRSRRLEHQSGVRRPPPEGLQAAVRRHGAQVGVALDGDADRAIFVDEQGQVVDGRRRDGDPRRRPPHPGRARQSILSPP